MRYAQLFTGDAQAVQTKTDEALIWAGLDWDVRTRSALVVGMLDASSAQTLQALPPVTGPASLDVVRDAVAALRTKLRSMDADAQVASGWSLQLPQAAAIAHALCRAAWSAFERSGHGRAWIVAETLLPALKTTFNAADVSPLSRLAARAVTWRVGGQSAVANLALFDPRIVKVALSSKVAPILAAHTAFVKTL